MKNPRTPLQIVGEIENAAVDAVTGMAFGETISEREIRTIEKLNRILMCCEDLQRALNIAALEASLTPRAQHEKWKERQK